MGEAGEGIPGSRGAEGSLSNPAILGSRILSPTIYDEDTFLGARLALNDIQGTSVLLGGLVDHEDRSTAIFVEAKRRLTDRVSLEVEGRFFVNVDSRGDLAAVAQDDVFSVRAAWNL